MWDCPIWPSSVVGLWPLVGCGKSIDVFHRKDFKEVVAAVVVGLLWGEKGRGEGRWRKEGRRRAGIKIVVSMPTLGVFSGSGYPCDRDRDEQEA